MSTYNYKSSKYHKVSSRNKLKSDKSDITDKIDKIDIDDVINNDTINTHLLLLKIFKTLRHKDDKTNKLYLSEALKRYITWMNLLNDKFSNDDDDIPISPIDVCQIWHAHLLLPIKYFKDIEELYKEEYKFPLDKIHKIWNNSNNNEYLSSLKFWEKHTNQPWILNIQNDSPFSLNLVNAVIRQYKFTDKIINDYNTDKPMDHSKAIEKYKKFLLLVKNNEKNLVPTIDIDLCWHTHMLHAIDYRDFTKKYMGKIINYDDKISESILSDNFDKTSDIWYKNFNELYIDENFNNNKKNKSKDCGMTGTGWCMG
ncbi:5765_t:CDS:1 [Scutellospora calospora]|uniref:5765_t:CDS:1 n=1 Tax=Scutellospora calospora TaxID=85575 RepID=A0ACA9L620_9GLOM|nr:5765_t:CDS:1 [Scutellospora calospora]